MSEGAEFLFKELMRVLAKQGEIIREQLQASCDQNLALRRLDTESLAAAVKRLDELATQMSELDRLREQVQRKLENIFHLQQDVTVTKMLPKAPLETIFKLKELTAKIQNDLRQLEEVNGVNNLLNRRALQVNTELLALFKTGGRKQTYQDTGHLKDNGQTNAMLNKTV